MSPYWGISVFVDIYIYMFMAFVLQNGGVRDPMLVSSSCVYMYTMGVYIYMYIYIQPFVWHVVGVGLEPSPIQI